MHVINYMDMHVDIPCVLLVAMPLTLHVYLLYQHVQQVNHVT